MSWWVSIIITTSEMYLSSQQSSSSHDYSNLFQDPSFLIIKLMCSCPLGQLFIVFVLWHICEQKFVVLWMQWINTKIIVKAFVIATESLHLHRSKKNVSVKKKAYFENLHIKSILNITNENQRGNEKWRSKRKLSVQFHVQKYFINLWSAIIKTKQNQRHKSRLRANEIHEVSHAQKYVAPIVSHSSMDSNVTDL